MLRLEQNASTPVCTRSARTAQGTSACMHAWLLHARGQTHACQLIRVRCRPGTTLRTSNTPAPPARAPACVAAPAPPSGRWTRRRRQRAHPRALPPRHHPPDVGHAGAVSVRTRVRCRPGTTLRTSDTPAPLAHAPACVTAPAPPSGLRTRRCQRTRGTTGSSRQARTPDGRDGGVYRVIVRERTPRPGYCPWAPPRFMRG